MGTALEVNHVWKKFNRGEFNDSLRDAIPAMLKGLVGLGPSKTELQKNEFWALKDVNFKVEEGESVALIGHNGAGKSTLLKIFSKILKPNRGSIKVNGRMRALIEIGSGFHGDLTGRENIFLNGSILGMSRKEIQSKFDAIVDFAGIEEFLDMPVKRYSSGMYARLGFAVAAHLEPEILIVDEVLAVGDTAFQRKCLGKMNEVASEGRTVVFVSHNMTAVRNLCPRAILFDHGEMLDDGPTFSIVNKYYGLIRKTQHQLVDSCRSGAQKARITNVLTGRSENTLSINGYCDCYGPLQIRIFFEVYEPVNNPVFSFTVIDGQEIHMLACATRNINVQLPPLTKNGYMDFFIEHFPLNAGLYIFGTAILEKIGNTENRIDHFVGDSSLTVMNVDFDSWLIRDKYSLRCFTPYKYNLVQE